MTRHTRKCLYQIINIFFGFDFAHVGDVDGVAPFARGQKNDTCDKKIIPFKTWETEDKPNLMKLTHIAPPNTCAIFCVFFMTNSTPLQASERMLSYTKKWYRATTHQTTVFAPVLWYLRKHTSLLKSKLREKGYHSTVGTFPTHTIQNTSAIYVFFSTIQQGSCHLTTIATCVRLHIQASPLWTIQMDVRTRYITQACASSLCGEQLKLDKQQLNTTSTCASTHLPRKNLQKLLGDECQYPSVVTLGRQRHVSQT